MKRLRYGPNPQQRAWQNNSRTAPIQVINGKPGFINFWDAIDGIWGVLDASKALGRKVASVSKHESGSGMSMDVPLTDLEKKLAFCEDKKLTPLAEAFIGALQIDALSGFGGVASFSDEVDYATAAALKPWTLDVAIAPGFEPEALKLLKEKKKGKFVVMQVDPDFDRPDYYNIEKYGMQFTVERNKYLPTFRKLGRRSLVSENTHFPRERKEDMLLALYMAKISQSNTCGVGYLGRATCDAGGQNRLDITKGSGKRMELWALRHHPRVVGLKFKDKIRRSEKINTAYSFANGDLFSIIGEPLQKNLLDIPTPLTLEERTAFLREYFQFSAKNGADVETGEVSFAQDAFEPFSDAYLAAIRASCGYMSETGIGMNFKKQILPEANARQAVVHKRGKNGRLFKHVF
jgi:phosphoribosylaminoimidazolecarboxamide formyltransferase / IMP cyclohydrolase